MCEPIAFGSLMFGILVIERISGYQVLAHFAQLVTLAARARFGRGYAEFPLEQVRKMTVARKTKIEREAGQISRVVRQHFERSPQTKKGQIAMNRNTGFALKYPRKVEWRCPDLASDI